MHVKGILSGISKAPSEIPYKMSCPVFEIALGTLVDIWFTNELNFGGLVLILVDQRNMQ